MGGERGTNLLDGGAPFYNIYKCKDGGYMSVGCLEPQFFKVFLELFVKNVPAGFSVDGGWVPTLKTQTNRAEWPKFERYLEQGFLTGTRDFWTKVYHGPSYLSTTFLWDLIRSFLATEACTVPVLTPQEAAKASKAVLPEAHPKIISHGSPQPSRKPTLPSLLQPGQHTDEILEELGFEKAERDRLRQQGVFGNATKAKL